MLSFGKDASMKKFKQYYFLPFVGLGSIAVFGWYQNEGSIDLMLGAFLIFVGLILPFLVGLIRDRFDHQWTPAIRKKAYANQPYTDLLNRGFENKEHVYLEGVIDGYSVFIIHDRRLTIGVSLLFFFDPQEINDTHYNAFLKKIVKSKFEMSILGNLLTKVECGLKPCKIDAIENRLNEGVAFLKKHNYQPIDPLELKRLYEKRGR